MLIFACEAIWSRTFNFCECLYYCFNFINCYCSIQVSDSSWLNSGILYVCRNLSISSKLSNFLVYSCSQCYFFKHSFVFLWYRLLLLFHCWFFLIWLFFLFSWWVICLFCLLKNQLLISLIFCIFVVIISMSFISTPIFIIFYLLGILGIVCCFSSSFRHRFRLFIWDFSCFLRKACNAVNFSLRTVLECPLDLGLFCVCFNFFPGNF